MCTIKDKTKKYEQGDYIGRKIIVVGMRLDGIEGIHEQAFYSSSGLNSIESLEKFFETKFKPQTEKEAGIWIPFSGIGYDHSDISKEEDYYHNVKLMKTYFSCSEYDPKNCLYGRFGKGDPNLMQISYCLGGEFWENNIDNPVFEKYGIKRCESLCKYIEDFHCYYIPKHENNLECSIELNEYIGSAMVFNYAPELLATKNRVRKFFGKGDKYDFDKLKFDWRIYNILYEQKVTDNRGSKMFLGRASAPLPIESRFGGNLWVNYLTDINTLYIKDPTLFGEYIIPLINTHVGGGNIFCKK